MAASVATPRMGFSRVASSSEKDTSKQGLLGAVAIAVALAEPRSDRAALTAEFRALRLRSTFASDAEVANSAQSLMQRARAKSRHCSRAQVLREVGVSSHGRLQEL